MGRTYILQPPGGAPRAVKKLPPQRLGGPLSNEQKAKLCILIRDAYGRQEHASANPSTEEIDTFRHEECQRAVGKPGLTACVQDDWKPLLAHFLAMTGATDRAFEAAYEHGTEPARVAMFKLHEALRKAGLPMAYAAAISRRQHHGKEPSGLNPKQLWQLTYTINNRGAGRRREA